LAHSSKASIIGLQVSVRENKGKNEFIQDQQQPTTFGEAASFTAKVNPQTGCIPHYAGPAKRLEMDCGVRGTWVLAGLV
jgi:hypothetical protein